MATTTIGLRSARADDAPALARLSGVLGYPADADTIERRLAALTGPDHNVLVAVTDGGTVIGWIHGAVVRHLESGAFAEIAGLVVAPEHRRLGVARQLVTATEAWASAAGLPALRVRTRVERDDALGLYAALGFERLKSQHVLAKRLPAG